MLFEASALNIDQHMKIFVVLNHKRTASLFEEYQTQRKPFFKCTFSIQQYSSSVCVFLGGEGTQTLNGQYILKVTIRPEVPAAPHESIRIFCATANDRINEPPKASLSKFCEQCGVVLQSIASVPERTAPCALGEAMIRPLWERIKAGSVSEPVPRV